MLEPREIHIQVNPSLFRSIKKPRVVRVVFCELHLKSRSLSTAGEIEEGKCSTVASQQTNSAAEPLQHHIKKRSRKKDMMTNSASPQYNRYSKHISHTRVYLINQGGTLSVRRRRSEHAQYGITNAGPRRSTLSRISPDHAIHEQIAVCSDPNSRYRGMRKFNKSWRAEERARKGITNT
jgi:hypothetical protein